MVVVSAPKSTSAQPERISFSVKTAFANAIGAISRSAISTFACSKLCSRFFLSEARATMLRNCPVMCWPATPTGSACRVLSILYSWGATSSTLMSANGTSRFSSQIESTSSCEMMPSSSSVRLTAFFTVRNDCPPMPTYTLAMELLSWFSSLLVMEVNACAVLSML